MNRNRQRISSMNDITNIDSPRKISKKISNEFFFNDSNDSSRKKTKHLKHQVEKLLKIDRKFSPALKPRMIEAFLSNLCAIGVIGSTLTLKEEKKES